MIKKFYEKTKEVGSISSSLLSVGLATLGVLQSARTITQVNQGNYAVKLEEDQQAIQYHIASNMECSPDVSQCTEGSCVELSSYEGKVLIAQDGSTKMGALNVKACCQNGSLRLLTAMGPEAPFGRHPLTKQTLSWDAPWGNLMDLGAYCSGAQTRSTQPSSTSIVYGPICKNGQGSCRHPYFGTYIMCCPDGRDFPKPQCPAGSSEVLAYWDRLDAWGADGLWVVLCK